MEIYEYALATVILVVLELFYFKIADKANIVDKPNERSSHKTPLICGGGVIFLLAAWLWCLFCGFHYPWFFAGMTLIAGVSFIDDVKPLPVRWRLLVQVISTCFIFQEWGMFEWHNWWILLLAFILCVGIINAYNFMDGINGITGGYSLAILIPLLYINHNLHFMENGLIEIVIISVFVFCFFNFRKNALCCAGDVGSIGIAFFLVFSIGKLIVATGDFTYILFLVVYGVDTVLTIVHRIMLHENLGQAHRKHCYQLMANELGMSHVKVSIIYTVLQLAISAGLMCINSNTGRWIYFVGVIVVISTVYVLFMKKYYHLHEQYLRSLK